MCVGYMEVLHHFIQGIWASVDFGIQGGPWNLSPTDTEGRLYAHFLKYKIFKEVYYISVLNLWKLTNIIYLEGRSICW